MLPLVLTVVLLLVSNLLFCIGKKTPAVVVSSTSEVDPPISVVNKEKTPMETPKEPEPKKEEKTMDCTLDKLPAIAILLNQEAGLDEEFIEAVLRLAIRTESYMWAMKKRLSADENSWKELSKKIEKLKAEGFCVKAGSEEAKQLRKQNEGGQNLLAATMAKNKAASRLAKKEE